MFADVANAHAWVEAAQALALRALAAPCPAHVPRLAPIVTLSDRVTRILALNPSALTLRGTNTYLVGTGRERALIDCGEGRAGYDTLLLRAMRERGVERIACVVCTHWHPDHVGGLARVRRALGYDVPAYKVIRKNKGEWVASEQTRGSVRAYVPVEDDDVIRVEGATLRALRTPGHTVDHACFALEEEGAIFAGDCVLNGSTTDFEDLTAYSTSLGRLKDELASFGKRGTTLGGENRLYPSHGDVVVDGAAKVNGYIAHRVSRENMLLNTLREHVREGLTTWELTRAMYASLVSTLVLYTSCAKITRLHLQKMLDDGVVRESHTASALSKLTFGALGGDVVRYHAVSP